MSHAYEFEVGASDLSVAFDAEADRAERERFNGVRDRQRANALHVVNAVRHFQAMRQPGERIKVSIKVELVPAVNPVLKRERELRLQ